jgi:hypothetical protein
MIKQDEVRKALERFSEQVIKQAKANIVKDNKKASGKGYNSLKYDLSVHRRSFSLGFEMEDYMDFQDQGVKGAKSTYASALNSPFRFGTGSSGANFDQFKESIGKWVRQKGIQGRDRKTGRFITVQSLSALIARSIYNKGIRGSIFFTQPFNDSFGRLPDEIVKAFDLDVDRFLQETNTIR